MFGKIFGSDKEEKIEELKTELEEKNQELEELEKELEQEKKRAKEAITEKQNTDKELKESRHKIESLEDRINNLKKEKEKESIGKEAQHLSRTETISLLDELEGLKGGNKSFTTHYIESLQETVDDKIARILQGIDSETGFIHLKDQFELINCILIPPLPVESEFYRDEKFHLEKVRKSVEPERSIGFASIHAGKSGIGVLEEAEFASFDIVKTSVKSKHSKGGSSQGRFERGREKQIQKHIKEVMEQIEDSVNNPDYMILDGNNKMISELENKLSINTPIIKKSLDIGNVNEDDKEEYVEKILGTRLYIL